MKMKNIFYITLASLLIFIGCEKNLEPEIYGNINSSIFPKTEDDYVLYTMEAYKTFTSKWEYFPIDNVSYHMWFSVEQGYYQLFDYGTDQMPVFTGWGAGFEIPSSANYEPFVNHGENVSPFNKVKEVTRITKIIDDLEKADISTDKKNMLLGEARVSRGWTMYLLMHLFGPVPVITDPELVDDYEALSDMTRPDRSEFVNIIATDLRFAADNLPKEMPEYGRFNKGLALTLLMRLYMNERDFVKAEPVGREIQAMGYALVDDYASIFMEETERNTETIFAISCDGSSEGREPDPSFNPYSFYFYPGDYPENPGWGAGGDPPYSASWTFYKSYAANDKRRETLVSTYITSDSTVYDSTSLPGAIVNKFPKTTDGPFAGNDLVIARYADVMLMLAEAINENKNGPDAEAIAFVDSVRARAGIEALPASDIASKETFNDAILRERGWELFYEGVRKFDLERHGKWPELVNEVPDKDAGPYLLPIPQYALSASDGKLTQNKGY